jgi:hypothetical protein
VTGLGARVAEAIVIALLAGGAMAAAQRVAQGSSPDHARTPPVSPTQVVLAVIAGLLAWAATGWPVAGAWAAIGGWAGPILVRRDRVRAAETARLDGWATWVGLIGGQLAGQASLAESLLGACQRAPAVLAADVRPLGDALAVVPLDEALSAWGADRAESAELRQVALVLGLAAAGAGGHVSQVLAQLGGQLRARAASARRVERERRRIRLAGRAAAGVAAAWMLAGARLDHSLFGVYSDPAGQILLAVLLGVVAAGLWGLARLDRGLV